MTEYFRQWLGSKYGSDAALAKAWADPRQTTGGHLAVDTAATAYFGYTATGGERDVTWVNGKRLHLRLAPKSTTVLDNETGEPLMPDAR